MRGLVLRDIYYLRQNWKIYVGLMVFGVIFAINTQSSYYLLFVCIFFGINVAFSVPALQEGGGYAYSLCLPVHRKEIIKSSYISVFGFIVLNVLSAGGVTVVLCLSGAIEYTVEDVGLLFVLLSFYLISTEVVLPVAVKWNTNKARALLMVVFMGLFGSLWLFSDMGILTEFEMSSFILRNFSLLIFLLFLIALAGIWISYRISAAIFEKTDF